MDSQPEWIETEEQLEEVLTRPRPILVDFMRGLQGPLVILGAGGKMGPSLAVLARRAAAAAGTDLEVIAVSRYSDPAARESLERQGVRTLSCDLMQPDQLGRLPEAENVIYLVGVKFGTTQNPARTWAYNTVVPANVARRYPQGRLVALSSGNVYPLVPAPGTGPGEDCPLTPLGEYANSVVARERVLEYFSQENGSPLALVRLNYALDLRYGVLTDLAEKILRRRPVDLAMGYFNCIWQGDANDAILRLLGLASFPAQAWNLTGPETLSVRSVAQRLGELLGAPVALTGAEAPTALLSSPARLWAALGAPPTPVETLLRWTAYWVKQGGRSLGKPTHFEVRNGGY